MRRLVVIGFSAIMAFAAMVVVDVTGSPQMIGPNLSIEKPRVPDSAPAGPATCPCSDASNYTVGGGTGPIDDAWALTSEAIDAMNALCVSNGGTPQVSCPDDYSYGLFCSGGSLAGNYAYWEAIVTEPPGFQCATAEAWSGASPGDGEGPLSGVVQGITEAEYDACVSEIVEASTYPGACPP